MANLAGGIILVYQDRESTRFVVSTMAANVK